MRFSPEGPDYLQPQQPPQWKPTASDEPPSGPLPCFTQLNLAAANGRLSEQTPPPSPASKHADGTPPSPLAAADKALRLRYLAPAAYLHRAVSSVLGSAFDVDAFDRYLSDLLADAGSPTDPVECMLLEQLAWSHHLLGMLHVLGSAAPSVEAARIFQAAAARLMAEFRRTALALKAYRQPAAGPKARRGSSPGANGPAIATNGHPPGTTALPGNGAVPEPAAGAAAVGDAGRGRHARIGGDDAREPA